MGAPFRNRSNIFDLEYGELKGYINASLYTYINSNHIGDGLIWNGSKLTGGAYINCFMFGSSYTTGITQSATWTKLNVETTEGFSRDGFVHTNNRITNIDGLRIIKLEAIVSVSSGNNNEIHLAFFKNGEIVPCSEQELVTNSGGRLSGAAIQCLTQVDVNDYVEVWTKNQSGTTDIICSNYNFIVTEL